MTPQQARTAKRIAPALGLFFIGAPVLLWFALYVWAALLLFAFASYALWVEGKAVAQGGCSTISEIAWMVWAEQPWVVWLASVIVSNVTGFLVAVFFDKQTLVLVNVVGVTAFLSGHLFGQASDKYAAIRRGEEP